MPAITSFCAGDILAGQGIDQRRWPAVALENAIIVVDADRAKMVDIVLFSLLRCCRWRWCR